MVGLLAYMYLTECELTGHFIDIVFASINFIVDHIHIFLLISKVSLEHMIRGLSELH